VGNNVSKLNSGDTQNESERPAAAAAIRALPPVETEAIEGTSRAHVAAGITSVLKAVEFTLKEPGLKRGVAAMARLNQFDGIDCPGCAWPDPDHDRSFNEYCENGAKAISEEATSKRCTPQFFCSHSLAELSQQSDYWLGHQGRLTHPMVLRSGSDYYEPVSWDDAFAMIAGELNALASPDEAVFYTSAAPATRRRFSINSSCDSSAPIICPTAPICVTSLPAWL
jgi:anaerobic selenocysteine-containing dehydrogenase